MDHAIRTGDKEGVLKFLQNHHPNAVLDYYMNLAKRCNPHLLPLLELYNNHRKIFSMAEIVDISKTLIPIERISKL